MHFARRHILVIALATCTLASQCVSAQGRLEIDIHLKTGNNIAISTGESTAGQADSKNALTESHDGAAYAGSIIVDLSICKDHATLVNITNDNTAVGGTVAGSIVMTDAGIEGVFSSKNHNKSKGK